MNIFLDKTGFNCVEPTSEKGNIIFTLIAALHSTVIFGFM